jgi:single-stranded DNA-binding protein
MLEGIVISGFADQVKSGTFDNGTVWANFTVRVSEYKGKNPDGTAKREAAWYNCKSYDKLAERVIEHMPAEGSETRAIPVVVQGELRTDTYEDKDGNNRKAIYIRANDVRSAEFLGAGMIVEAAMGIDNRKPVSAGSEPF